MSDYDSDSSSKSDEPQSSSNPINSLQAELSKITSIVKQLDDFKPEVKKKVGRPKARPSTTQPDTNTIPNTLISFCTLAQKILLQLNTVHEENNSLKSRITKLEATSGTNSKENIATGRAFAAVVAGKSVPAPKAINQIDARLDQVEQLSLSTILKLDGELIAKKIEKHNSKDPKDHIKFTKDIIEEINKAGNNLVKEEEVTNVSIVGKDKKHLKVNVVTSEIKIKILKTFKLNKPVDFYASQYLTRNRVSSLFRLRSIKRGNPRVESVYSYSGNICCKLSNVDQIFYLNNSIAIDNFVSLHKLDE